MLNQLKYLLITTYSLTMLLNCSSITTHNIIQKDKIFSITVPDSINRCLAIFQTQVDSIVNADDFKTAIIGIQIENYKSGELIFSMNPHTLLIPASNMKLITTVSALSYLGPNYKYETGLYMDGTIDDGILDGNLIIKGSGDPSISGRYNGGCALAVFTEWADTLLSLGITGINGTIIGDDNIFDDIDLGYGWSWDDLSYYYAAETSGLSFNDNCIDLFIIPGDTVGEKARVTTFPEMEYLNLKNEITTVSNRNKTKIDVNRIPGTDDVTVFGTIRTDADTVSELVTVSNPTYFTLSAFKYILEENGITVSNISDIDDIPLINPDYDNYQLIAQHCSVPLSEIIRIINKDSQNFYAEQLQKTLGVEQYQTGSAEAGIKAEKHWLDMINVCSDEIRIVDGSGLSRHNLVSASQVISILRNIRNDPNWEIFRESLAIAGKDGTLFDRFIGSEAAGHVYAKTGSLGYVRTISGFVKAKNGQEYLFSILVNHYSVPKSTVDAMQEQIITLLYTLDY